MCPTSQHSDAVSYGAMEPNEIAADVLNKKITTLENEVTRLKQYEPKPTTFGVGWLVAAALAGVVFALVFCGR